MLFSLTIFRNRFDVKTHKRMDFGNFDALENLLFGLAKKHVYVKEKAPLISPATFEEGSTRSNANVVDWGGWAALDVDDIRTTDFKFVLQERFGGKYYICYSTASSTYDHPKFRLVFPLTKRVPADQIRNFWFALNSMAGNMGDTQVKDLSRMYYVPADYRIRVGTNSFIFKERGDYLDVDDLIHRYPMPQTKPSFLERFPPEKRGEILKWRKDSMDNTNVTWSSYHDCPFWPSHLEMEYKAITNTGWYHMMYKILVSIASRAIHAGYPITAHEMAELCRQFDAETGGWYENRPLEKEAERALEYAYENVL